jgi:hypothetical protein
LQQRLLKLVPFLFEPLPGFIMQEHKINDKDHKG